MVESLFIEFFLSREYLKIILWINLNYEAVFGMNIIAVYTFVILFALKSQKYIKAWCNSSLL